MRIYLTVAATLLLSISCHAQSYSNKLEVGQPYPDTLFSSLKGTPVILDFFSSSCVVCFKAMPKINELRQKNKGSLQFMLIGKEDGKIRKVYEKFRERFKLDLPVIFDSSLFRRLEIKGTPLVVWIAADGIVKAISYTNELTQENINDFLANRPMKEGMIPERISFNQRKPFLANGNGGPDSAFLYRSLLTYWDPTKMIYLPPVDYATRPDSIQYLGATMADLYNYAFFGKTAWMEKDPMYGYFSRFPVKEDTTLEVQGQPMYCYSLWLSPEQKKFTTAQEIFKNDLANFFGYTASLEVRKMPYYKIMVRPGFHEKLRSKLSRRFGEMTHAGFNFQRSDVKLLVNTLARRFYYTPPFIDATGIDFPIDVKVEAVMTEFDDVRKQLYESGIELRLAYKDMKVIVLRSRQINVAANRLLQH